MLKIAPTYDNALASATAHAATGVAANFQALAAGTIAFMVGQTWADKADRKPVADIKADVQSAFSDTVGKKSKAYEFSALALKIARDLSKGAIEPNAAKAGMTVATNAWAAELRTIVRDTDSLEEGVTFLANRFHSVAPTVAKLAAHYGDEKKTLVAKPFDFAALLNDLIEEAKEEGVIVPVNAGINALLNCGDVSPMDANAMLNRMVKTFDSVSLAALTDTLNDTLGQRLDVERKATMMDEIEREESESIAA